MDVKSITVSMQVKIPMQDYGSITATATFQAEINPEDVPDQCANLLGIMAREELTRSVMPLIQNRLDFTAYVMRNWDRDKSNKAWNGFMDSESVGTLMRSGIVPVSVMQEAVEAMMKKENSENAD